MCLFYMVEKLNFEGPHFGAPNFLYLIFPSYLPAYPEIVMFLAYTIKNFEFSRLYLRKAPIVVTPKIFQILSFPHILLF